MSLRGTECCLCCVTGSGPAIQRPVCFLLLHDLHALGEAGKFKELAPYSLLVLEEVELFCLKKKKVGCLKSFSGSSPVGQHLTPHTWGEQARLCGHLLNRQDSPRTDGLVSEPGAGAQGMVWQGDRMCDHIEGRASLPCRLQDVRRRAWEDHLRSFKYRKAEKVKGGSPSESSLLPCLHVCLLLVSCGASISC